MKLIIAVFFLLMHPAKDMKSTVQTQKPIFSFGVVADVQYSDADPANNRYYRLSKERLVEAYRTFTDDSVSFVVNLGDLIDGNFASFAPVMDIITSSKLKTYHVTGNHDYAVEKSFRKKLPVLTESKRGYYSFTKEGFRFIFLNGNEISTYGPGNKAELNEAAAYLNSLKAEKAINAMDWNGGIGNGQLGWLKNELDKSVKGNQKVFIFCHFPVFPVNAHNLFNYNEVLKLLEKYNNIIAWINGHNHAGNYGNFNMIHFVTLRGMVETEKTGSYSIVDVYTNKIWIRGFGREKSQILAY